jgi:microcystin-dependent protein
MTNVTIPNRPLGTDTRSIEMILADFDAITSVINGQLDSGNMSPTGQQSMVLPGDIVVSAATSRVGCLLCDGSAVSRNLYPGLFAAIGTYYGAGDGTSTFNVPDYRGRTIIGAGAGPGLTPRGLGQGGGVESHALTVNELAVHNHTISDPGHAHLIPHYVHTSEAMGAGASYVGGSTSAYWALNMPTDARFTGIGIANTGQGNGHENMQPFGVANVFIKT